MTPFNHCKYHFTRGIPIPSRASEKTKAHRVRPFKSTWRLAAGRDTREQLCGFSQRTVSVWSGLMGTRWKDRNLLPQKSWWIWRAGVSAALVSLLWFISKNVCRAMMVMTKWFLVMNPIKGSIFCLSDVSMSKLFGGTVCLNPLSRWPPTGITTVCGRTDIYSLCKSLSSWDVYHTPYCAASFIKQNCNPGAAANTVVHGLLVIAGLLTRSPREANRKSLMQ